MEIIIKNKKFKTVADTAGKCKGCCFDEPIKNECTMPAEYAEELASLCAVSGVIFKDVTNAKDN